MVLCVIVILEQFCCEQQQMNEVRDFGVNQFTGKYLTDTGYKDVVQEQG